MRQFAKAALCSLPLMAIGCGFMQNIRKNVVASPLYAATECVDHKRHQQMAREAWAEMACAYPEFEYSCDYRRGFVDGFADYLDYGGSGEPPPVPPPSYRISRYETPLGLAMMEDWTCGFRHGAATAMASGLRELVTFQIYKGPSYGPAPLEGAPSGNARPLPNPSIEEKPTVPVPPPPAPETPPTDKDKQEFESASK